MTGERAPTRVLALGFHMGSEHGPEEKGDKRELCGRWECGFQESPEPMFIGLLLFVNALQAVSCLIYLKAL